MSVALIIHSANFAATAIETIEVTEPVPCTGITISDSSITFDAIGATQTLTPTVTPNNCTDTVVWNSSDSSVATVSNGVVTSTGIGTATITATCGSYSDTCTISVGDVQATTKWLIGYCTPTQGTGATVAGNTGRLTCVESIESGSDATSEVIVSISDSPENGKVLKALNIPSGASTLTVHQIGMPSYATAWVCFYDGTTAGNTRYPAMLSCVEKQTKDTNINDIAFDIPSGCTKATLTVSTGRTYNYASTNADDAAAEFSLSITYT